MSAPETYHSGIVAPAGIWWKRAHKAERIWVTIAFAWCMVLFAMMPLWHFKGGQNPSGIRGTVEPGQFYARVQSFTAAYQVAWDTIRQPDGSPGLMAVVEPPPGADVYMVGRMWAWEPVLRLHEGTEYTLHLSALDVNHGFSLYPVNVNFQIVPGYDYGLRVRPNEVGDFRVICNEFCGIGHHTMVGRVVVVGRDVPALPLLRDSVMTPADTTAGGAR